MNKKSFIVVFLLLIALSVVVAVGWNLSRSQSNDSLPEIKNGQDDSYIESQEESDTQAKPAPDSSGLVAPEGAYIFKMGEFTKTDSNRYAEGEAHLINDSGNYYLRLVNFKSVNGSDLHLYLSENSEVSKQGLGNYISLGPLKPLEGEQEYILPENIEKYRTVVIWSKESDSLFSTAALFEVMY